MMNDSKSLHSRIAQTVQDLPRSGIRDFFDIVSSREDVISLGIGEPDFVTPWHICEAATLALSRGATSYTSNMGLFSLRQGISRYVKKKSGILYRPEDEILITVGVSEGLDLAIRALVEPGDEVLYLEPSYVSFGPLVSLAHGVPVAVETK
jgi:aminotransferase